MSRKIWCDSCDQKIQWGEHPVVLVIAGHEEHPLFDLCNQCFGSREHLTEAIKLGVYELRESRENDV